MKKNRMTQVIVAIFLLLILIPVCTIFMWIFTERWAWPDFLPQVFSLRAVNEIFSRKEALTAMMGSSILISVSVAVLSVAVGCLTARALTCYEFRGKGVMYFLSMLPFMVPTTVFAMGVQVIFIKMGLNNTVAGVIIAHLMYSLPYAVKLIMDGMEAVGMGLEEQARVLGASPLTAFFRVTFPMLVPVLVSAFSMAYVVSFGQYFLTLLIGGGQVKTFAIVMVPYLQGGDRNIACIYSVLFLAVTLVVFGLAEKIAGHWTKDSAAEYYS